MEKIDARGLPDAVLNERRRRALKLREAGVKALGQVLLRKDTLADVPAFDAFGEGENVGPSDGWGSV